MNYVQEPKYDVIKSFENGFARVKNNDFWGIIDVKGKVVVDVVYNEIGNFYNNITWAKKGETFGLIIEGKFKEIKGVDKIWDFKKDNITYVRKNDKIGFIDNNGNWIIQPIYDKAKSFVNGIAPVQLKDKWGYINLKNEIIVDFIYNDAEVLS